MKWKLSVWTCGIKGLLYTLHYYWKLTLINKLVKLLNPKVKEKNSSYIQILDIIYLQRKIIKPVSDFVLTNFKHARKYGSNVYKGLFGKSMRCKSLYLTKLKFMCKRERFHVYSGMAVHACILKILHGDVNWWENYKMSNRNGPIDNPLVIIFRFLLSKVIISALLNYWIGSEANWKKE